MSNYTSRVFLENTVIHFDGTDVEVDAIFFNQNPKVEYLPIKIDEKFPNLISYDASNCAIVGIIRKNFKRLHTLENVNLVGNQISVLKTKSFQGLLSLKVLNLGEL